jgi:hypothetical protein
VTKNAAMTAAAAVGAMLVDDGFDPIADAVRARGRGVIATIQEEEPDATTARPHYGRRKAAPAGSIDDAAPLPARSSRAHARACP